MECCKYCWILCITCQWVLKINKKTRQVSVLLSNSAVIWFRLAQNKRLGLLVIWHQCGRTALNKPAVYTHTHTHTVKSTSVFVSNLEQLMTVPLEKPFLCVCDYQHAVVDLLHVWLGELITWVPILPCRERERGVQFLDAYSCSVSIMCSYNGSVYEERSALWSYWADLVWKQLANDV